MIYSISGILNARRWGMDIKIRLTGSDVAGSGKVGLLSSVL